VKKIFRLVKNDHHYAIQQKFLWFFWRTVKISVYGNDRPARYLELKDAEKALKEMIEHELENEKRKTKYKVVKTKLLTKLYETINED
jgi:hypothetical protein